MKQATDRKLVFLAALVAWLLVSLLVSTAALAMIVLGNRSDDAAFDRVHAAGMELGNQMCMGFRSHIDGQPAQRQGGGLL